MTKSFTKWLKANNGKTFKTKTGKSFYYTLEKDGLLLQKESGVIFKCTYKNLANAVSQRPVTCPAEFSKDIFCKSYCWALIKEFDN